MCDFDPIGLGERLYDIRPMVAGRGVVFDDGTRRILLNARGASHDTGPSRLSGRLTAFLSYVDGGDTIEDEWVGRLDDEVRALNQDEGWRATMLGLDLDYQYDLDQARKAGVEEGVKLSLEQLVSKLGYTPEGALEFFDIPQQEWPFYLELLDS